MMTMMMMMMMMINPFKVTLYEVFSRIVEELEFLCKWTQLQSCSTHWPEYVSIHTFHMLLGTRNLKSNSAGNLAVP